jgi:hypothetical protein
MSRRVSRFWSGFALASLLWGAGGAYLVLVAGFAPPEPEPAPPVAAVESAPATEATADQPVRRRHRRRRRRSRAAGEETTPTGNATTGDDLREGDPRMVDMEGGGEQQLSAAQIEAGFDSGMGRIRRCLVLMAGSDPVRGQLTFGMRVASSGQVRAVQLSGPAAATTGDAGECLRAAARAIRFEPFDGPEMVVHYPLHLE